MRGITLLLMVALCTAAMAEETAPIENRVELSAAGRPYVVYVDGMPGTDITANIQKAIDTVRAANGGTVVLPPGDYSVTNTIHLAGSIDRFPKNGPRGIRLIGSGGAGGTTLHYRGPEFSTVIDIPAPWGCTVANFTIDADNTPGVVGIRYRGGYDRQTNGGKNNVFENLILRRMDIGLWVGDEFGPDLVGSTYRSIWISYCRLCVMIEGANVTGMAFYNLSVTNWNEAGVKVIGHTARRIRETADDEIPEPEVAGEPVVLTDSQTGKEIFQKDLPEYTLKTRTFTGEFRGYGPYIWAGGGAPDITVFNFNAHSTDPTTWAIDSNWGHVRVYSARIEGPAGIFRRTGTFGGGRFADYLVDVNATSPGGVGGNVIEYHGGGPLYLIGGTFEGNVALGNNAKVYDMGLKFFEWREKTGGLVPKDYVIPEGSGITRTGKERIFPGRRGMHDVVNIPLPRGIGYTQLPGTTGAMVHRMTPVTTRSVNVAKGADHVDVALTGADAQADDRYQVAVTPGFNTGGVWVTNKRNDGFTVRFAKPADNASSIDVIVRRAPYVKEQRIESRFKKK